MTKTPDTHDTLLDASDLAWVSEAVLPDSAAATSGALIGQDRAIAALRAGMELDGPGFNIFVSGLTGTRRAIGVKALLAELRAACRLVPDRLWVHNFQEPLRPRLISLPRGQGEEFADDMGAFFKSVMTLLPQALASPTLAERRRALQARYASREQLLYHDLVEACREQGLALIKLGDKEGTEPDIFPIIGEQPIAPEALEVLVREEKLEEAEAKRLEAARSKLVKRLYEARGKGQELALELMEKVDALGRATAEQQIAPRLDCLRERWKGPEFEAYFDGVHDYIADNLGVIVGYAQASEKSGLDEVRRPKELEVVPLPRAEPDPGDAWDCPVLLESNPTQDSLFGDILPPDPDGPRLSHITVGSIVRASGGYLILRLQDLQSDPTVWSSIKRVVKTGMLEVRALGEAQTNPSPLRPDPIEICAKIVLIGAPGTYELLCEQDPEFRKTFKIHAQFETTMPRTTDNLARYRAFARDLEEREGLLPPSPSGFARLAECGARKAGSRLRLSTRFGDLADLYREASHVAAKRAAKAIDREDFLETERRRDERLSLQQDKYLEAVRERRLRLDVDGQATGTLNGLVVLDTGAYVYGRPSRLSAMAGVGEEGVVNIERESELSGPIHEKGVQILSGFLLGRFAQSFPLRLHATLCFEQSYAGVDGDSASSTELYAILSALADVPIFQGLAVTGSVDQAGNVQAIGGANEKIEGYFRVCEELGLTGRQGVLIPKANVEDLMLMPDVVAAARDGLFRVHAIETIEQGLEVLTGMPAGTPDPDEDSVLGRAARKLRTFAQVWHDFD